MKHINIKRTNNDHPKERVQGWSDGGMGMIHGFWLSLEDPGGAGGCLSVGLGRNEWAIYATNTCPPTTSCLSSIQQALYNCLPGIIASRSAVLLNLSTSPLMGPALLNPANRTSSRIRQISCV